MSNILTHIFIFILKTLIPILFAFTIPVVMEYVYYPIQGATKFIVVDIAEVFSFFGTCVFLLIVDIMNFAGASNVVVDYFTKQHQFTLASYVKHGYANHQFFTTVFLSHLVICTLVMVFFLVSGYHDVQNKINSEMDINKCEI